jgi:hypothetical protein
MTNYVVTENAEELQEALNSLAAGVFDVVTFSSATTVDSSCDDACSVCASVRWLTFDGMSCSATSIRCGRMFAVRALRAWTSRPIW